MLSDDLEAVDAFDQSAKCFKMARNQQRAQEQYSQALWICKKSGRNIKGALVAEAMAEVCQDPEAMIPALIQAQELYELAEDRRASQIQERIAHAYAKIAKYGKASQYFMRRSMSLSEDPILIHAARKTWFLHLVYLAMDEDDGLNEEQSYPSWFVGTEEQRLLDRWLAYMSGDADEFKHNHDLPDWLHALKPSDSLC